MLRVGLVGEIGADTSTVLARLVELGAADHSIVVEELAPFEQSDVCARFQLVVGVGIPRNEVRHALADVWIDGTPERVDELWHGRLVLFEANLRAGRRASRRQQAIIVDPDPTWPAQAKRLISRLAAAAGKSATRIDHIGSTAVSGLPAKELIDIQVVVADLETAARVADESRAAGFVRVTGRCYGIDRHGNEHNEHVAVDADPGRPVNVHVHPVASPIWREMLLFRDWLRDDADGRAGYVALKRELAARPDHDVNDYGDDKMPWISAALVRAEGWAAKTAWSPDR